MNKKSYNNALKMKKYIMKKLFNKSNYQLKNFKKQIINYYYNLNI